MPRHAYHRAVLADGRVVDHPVVVVTDADGHQLSWHSLEGEEASTVWVGGDVKICIA
ncbi:MAG: hypothetical protein HUK01_00020 [Bacteroidaceae bacterium]|nr:hypothetical protein [Bacteroidaceae bacterium]